MGPGRRESKGRPKKGRIVGKGPIRIKGPTRIIGKDSKRVKDVKGPGKQQTQVVRNQKARSRRVRNVNKKDLKHFEKRLMDEREKLLEQLAHLEKDVMSQTLKEATGDLSAYTSHMADLGTDAMEREKAFLFASSEGRLLYHINEALRRLYKNEYGNCESCSQPISTERLEVVPHARLCIKCKEREEKAGQ